MLCPTCHDAAPGGQPCPTCGVLVPERESFEGQGDSYLKWLAACSLFLTIGSALGISHGFYELGQFGALWQAGTLQLVMAFAVAPLIVGIYYWALLREEEIIVTDECIQRRSRWGDERMAWCDIQSFQCHAVRFADTRLGQIARLASLFRDHPLLLDGRPISYELVAHDPSSGRQPTMLLEPGTIEEMPWLLALIEEHVGPATQVGLSLPI